MSDDCLIDAIPEELKHKIVDMLAASDERFELFEQALRKRQDSRTDYLNRMDRDQSLYGKSFVKHVRIVKPLIATTEFARFIGHLQRLSHVDSISLNVNAVASWFVSQSDPRIKLDETVQLCWATFSESLGKLNELVINSIDSAHPAPALLQSCCKLKSLTLEGMFRVSTWATSIQAVTHLPHLKHLKIAAVSGSSRELDLSSVLDKLKSAPAVPELSSLSIVAEDMHESWLLLANLFSATLTELAFESSYDDFDSSHLQAPSFCFSTEHFPRLQALSICGPFSSM
ncbi:hypothetical protein JCM3766R1_003839 [Sporobolomyces carnicolor]